MTGTMIDRVGAPNDDVRAAMDTVERTLRTSAPNGVFELELMQRNPELRLMPLREAVRQLQTRGVVAKWNYPGGRTRITLIGR
jgi:hypothetical protein